MDDRCCVCAESLAELSEMDRLTHVDKCLDAELEKKSEEIDKVETPKYEKPVIKLEESGSVYDLSGMPDFDNMPSAELKNCLNEYGMKKTIEVKQARIILKETWKYITYGVFPNFLEKFV